MSLEKYFEQPSIQFLEYHFQELNSKLDRHMERLGLEPLEKNENERD